MGDAEFGSATDRWQSPARSEVCREVTQQGWGYSSPSALYRAFAGAVSGAPCCSVSPETSTRFNRRAGFRGFSRVLLAVG